jgi:ABC-type molybdate transport system permease subunit
LTAAGAVDRRALVFARALGEYGATVRLSGNIPISTQLALVYTFGEVERVAPTIARDHM